MPETHDIPATKFFVSTLKYPRKPWPPMSEEGVETRETEPPFRIGRGRIRRIPGTRTAVVFGRWIDEGGPEEERLIAALRGRDVTADTDEIRDW